MKRALTIVCFAISCACVRAQTNIMSNSVGTIEAFYVVAVTNYHVNTIEYLIEQGELTNVVEKLLADGHVCAIVGHQWKNEPYANLIYHPDGNYPQYRKCALCGKMQKMEVAAWVDVK